MSSTRERVRSRRSPLDVAVIAADSTVGQALVRALVASSAGTGPAPPPAAGSRVGAVVAIDREEGRTGGAHWRLADPQTPAILGPLTGVGAAVVMLDRTDLGRVLDQSGSARRGQTLRRAQVAITAAAAAGVRHLVLITSAMVYGARPDNPVPLPEDAPLRAPSEEGLVGDLTDVEQLAAVAREVHPGLAVTVLRPAALVGPGVDTVITRHFEAPRLLTARGIEPAWQFCHLDDLATAATAALLLGPGALPAAITVGADSYLTQSEVEQISGMRRIELSETLALGTAQRLHRVGILPAPASDLAFALHPWVVGSQTLRAAGWQPAYDNVTCLGVLLEGTHHSTALGARRVDRRDTTLGAASAAVAIVGTAAIVRRRRRRGGTT